MPRFAHLAQKMLNLPTEELQRQHIEMVRANEEQHKQFSETFPNGECYLCGQQLTFFDKTQPCLHWLLRKNDKIKKVHIVRLLVRSDITQVLSYLRWIASSEKRLKNINDLKEEFSEGVFYQITIRYQNLSWSIYIAESDLKGHSYRKTDFPHYHFEFTIHNPKYPQGVFIKFADMHIPLADFDIFMLEIMRDDYPNLMHFNAYGESYEDLNKFLSPEQLISSLKHTDDPARATHHNQIIIQAEDGKKISGDVIANLIEESKRTGKTMSELAKKIPDAKVSVIVSPVEDAVDLRHNNPPRTRAKKNT
jgi:hypothetical protein